ncbi:hypothetical protein BDQ17DRAFT_1432460 [Cyathus striatus]|nr:hypothetical protein BDQ17DRAFT_1432460 [Cyathus striatus]
MFHLFDSAPLPLFLRSSSSSFSLLPYLTVLTPSPDITADGPQIPLSPAFSPRGRPKISLLSLPFLLGHGRGTRGCLTPHVQKERAAVGSTEVVKTKAKDKGKKAESEDELMTRMERTMKEANEEQSSESESADGERVDYGSIDEDDDGDDEEEEDEFTTFGMDSDDDTEAPPPPTAKAVVFPGDEEGEAKGKRRKKKTGASAKDVVLGSRILCTLPTTTESRPKPTAQPKKNNKFLERVLALKATSKSKGKRRERRAANVSVMRGMGPPAHFVWGA